MKMVCAYVTLVILYMSSTNYVVQGLRKTKFLSVECMDIYKQPAFQHPMLKNHKIQMEPSFKMKRTMGRALTSTKNVTLGIIEDIICTNGTVPIQKRNNGLLRPLTLNSAGRHFATLNSKFGGTYRGARATISIEQPFVTFEQFSGGLIWLQGGPSNEVNEIYIGWMANPLLYGDEKSRITGHWRGDNNLMGCYNTDCPGFVQISKRIYLGQEFSLVSLKKSSFGAPFAVVQDSLSGNWWFYYGDEKVGYWPKEIITHLDGGASDVAFGGVTNDPRGKFSPPMGRGSFPNKKSWESSSFKKLQTADVNYRFVDLDYSNMVVYVDAKQCYDLMYWRTLEIFGEIIVTYGGPGGIDCGT